MPITNPSIKTEYELYATIFSTFPIDIQLVINILNKERNVPALIFLSKQIISLFYNKSKWEQLSPVQQQSIVQIQIYIGLNQGPVRVCDDKIFLLKSVLDKDPFMIDFLYILRTNYITSIEQLDSLLRESPLYRYMCKFDIHKFPVHFDLNTIIDPTSLSYNYTLDTLPIDRPWTDEEISGYIRGQNDQHGPKSNTHSTPHNNNTSPFSNTAFHVTSSTYLSMTIAALHTTQYHRDILYAMAIKRVLQSKTDNLILWLFPITLASSSPTYLTYDPQTTLFPHNYILGEWDPNNDIKTSGTLPSQETSTDNEFNPLSLIAGNDHRIEPQKHHFGHSCDSFDNVQDGHISFQNPQHSRPNLSLLNTQHHNFTRYSNILVLNRESIHNYTSLNLINELLATQRSSPAPPSHNNTLPPPHPLAISSSQSSLIQTDEDVEDLLYLVDVSNQAQRTKVGGVLPQKENFSQNLEHHILESSYIQQHLSHEHKQVSLQAMYGVGSDDHNNDARSSQNFLNRAQKQVITEEYENLAQLDHGDNGSDIDDVHVVHIDEDKLGGLFGSDGNQSRQKAKNNSQNSPNTRSTNTQSDFDDVYPDRTELSLKLRNHSRFLQTYQGFLLPIYEIIEKTYDFELLGLVLDWGKKLWHINNNFYIQFLMNLVTIDDIKLYCKATEGPYCGDIGGVFDQVGGMVKREVGSGNRNNLAQHNQQPPHSPPSEPRNPYQSSTFPSFYPRGRTHMSGDCMPFGSFRRTPIAKINFNYIYKAILPYFMASDVIMSLSTPLAGNLYHKDNVIDRFFNDNLKKTLEIFETLQRSVKKALLTTPNASKLEVIAKILSDMIDGNKEYGHLLFVLRGSDNGYLRSRSTTCSPTMDVKTPQPTLTGIPTLFQNGHIHSLLDHLRVLELLDITPKRNVIEFNKPIIPQHRFEGSVSMLSSTNQTQEKSNRSQNLHNKNGDTDIHQVPTSKVTFPSFSNLNDNLGAVGNVTGEGKQNKFLINEHHSIYLQRYGLGGADTDNSLVNEMGQIGDYIRFGNGERGGVNLSDLDPFESKMIQLENDFDKFTRNADCMMNPTDFIFGTLRTQTKEQRLHMAMLKEAKNEKSHQNLLNSVHPPWLLDWDYNYNASTSTTRIHNHIQSNNDDNTQYTFPLYNGYSPPLYSPQSLVKTFNKNEYPSLPHPLLDQYQDQQIQTRQKQVQETEISSSTHFHFISSITQQDWLHTNPFLFSIASLNYPLMIYAKLLQKRQILAQLSQIRLPTSVSQSTPNTSGQDILCPDNDTNSVGIHPAHYYLSKHSFLYQNLLAILKNEIQNLEKCLDSIFIHIPVGAWYSQQFQHIIDIIYFCAVRMGDLKMVNFLSKYGVSNTSLEVFLVSLSDLSYFDNFDTVQKIMKLNEVPPASEIPSGGAKSSKPNTKTKVEQTKSVSTGVSLQEYKRTRVIELLRSNRAKYDGRRTAQREYSKHAHGNGAHHNGQINPHPDLTGGQDENTSGDTIRGTVLIQHLVDDVCTSGEIIQQSLIYLLNHDLFSLATALLDAICNQTSASTCTAEHVLIPSTNNQNIISALVQLCPSISSLRYLLSVNAPLTANSQFGNKNNIWFNILHNGIDIRDDQLTNSMLLTMFYSFQLFYVQKVQQSALSHKNVFISTTPEDEKDGSQTRSADLQFYSKALEIFQNADIEPSPTIMTPPTDDSDDNSSVLPSLLHHKDRWTKNVFNHHTSKPMDIITDLFIQVHVSSEEYRTITQQTEPHHPPLTFQTLNISTNTQAIMDKSTQLLPTTGTVQQPQFGPVNQSNTSDSIEFAHVAPVNTTSDQISFPLLTTIFRSPYSWDTLSNSLPHGVDPYSFPKLSDDDLLDWTTGSDSKRERLPLPTVKDNHAEESLGNIQSRLQNADRKEKRWLWNTIDLSLVQKIIPNTKSLFTFLWESSSDLNSPSALYQAVQDDRSPNDVQKLDQILSLSSSSSPVSINNNLSFKAHIPLLSLIEYLLKTDDISKLNTQIFDFFFFLLTPKELHLLSISTSILADILHHFEYQYRKYVALESNYYCDIAVPIDTGLENLLQKNTNIAANSSKNDSDIHKKRDFHQLLASNISQYYQAQAPAVENQKSPKLSLGKLQYMTVGIHYNHLLLKFHQKMTKMRNNYIKILSLFIHSTAKTGLFSTKLYIEPSQKVYDSLRQRKAAMGFQGGGGRGGEIGVSENEMEESGTHSIKNNPFIIQFLHFSKLIQFSQAWKHVLFNNELLRYESGYNYHQELAEMESKSNKIMQNYSFFSKSDFFNAKKLSNFYQTSPLHHSNIYPHQDLLDSNNTTSQSNPPNDSQKNDPSYPNVIKKLANYSAYTNEQEAIYDTHLLSFYHYLQAFREDYIDYLMIRKNNPIGADGKSGYNDNRKGQIMAQNGFNSSNKQSNQRNDDPSDNSLTSDGLFNFSIHPYEISSAISDGTYENTVLALYFNNETFNSPTKMLNLFKNHQNIEAITSLITDPKLTHNTPQLARLYQSIIQYCEFLVNQLRFNPYLTSIRNEEKRKNRENQRSLEQNQRELNQKIDRALQNVGNNDFNIGSNLLSTHSHTTQKLTQSSITQPDPNTYNPNLVSTEGGRDEYSHIDDFRLILTKALKQCTETMSPFDLQPPPTHSPHHSTVTSAYAQNRQDKKQNTTLITHGKKNTSHEDSDEVNDSRDVTPQVEPAQKHPFYDPNNPLKMVTAPTEHTLLAEIIDLLGAKCTEPVMFHRFDSRFYTDVALSFEINPMIPWDRADQDGLDDIDQDDGSEDDEPLILPGFAPELYDESDLTGDLFQRSTERFYKAIDKMERSHGARNSSRRSFLFSSHSCYKDTIPLIPLDKHITEVRERIEIEQYRYLPHFVKEIIPDNILQINTPISKTGENFQNTLSYSQFDGFLGGFWPNLFTIYPNDNQKATNLHNAQIGIILANKNYTRSRLLQEQLDLKTDQNSRNPENDRNDVKSPPKKDPEEHQRSELDPRLDWDQIPTILHGKQFTEYGLASPIMLSNWSRSATSAVTNPNPDIASTSPSNSSNNIASEDQQRVNPDDSMLLPLYLHRGKIFGDQTMYNIVPNNYQFHNLQQKTQLDTAPLSYYDLEQRHESIGTELMNHFLSTRQINPFLDFFRYLLLLYPNIQHTHLVLYFLNTLDSPEPYLHSFFNQLGFRIDKEGSIPNDLGNLVLGGGASTGGQSPGKFSFLGIYTSHLLFSSLLHQLLYSPKAVFVAADNIFDPPSIHDDTADTDRDDEPPPKAASVVKKSTPMTTKSAFTKPSTKTSTGSQAGQKPIVKKQPPKPKTDRELIRGASITLPPHPSQSNYMKFQSILSSLYPQTTGYINLIYQQQRQMADLGEMSPNFNDLTDNNPTPAPLTAGQSDHLHDPHLINSPFYRVLATLSQIAPSHHIYTLANRLKYVLLYHSVFVDMIQNTVNNVIIEGACIEEEMYLERAVERENYLTLVTTMVDHHHNPIRNPSQTSQYMSFQDEIKAIQYERLKGVLIYDMDTNEIPRHDATKPFMGISVSVLYRFFTIRDEIQIWLKKQIDFVRLELAQIFIFSRGAYMYLQDPLKHFHIEDDTDGDHEKPGKSDPEHDNSAPLVQPEPRKRNKRKKKGRFLFNKDSDDELPQPQHINAFKPYEIADTGERDEVASSKPSTTPTDILYPYITSHHFGLCLGNINNINNDNAHKVPLPLETRQKLMRPPQVEDTKSQKPQAKSQNPSPNQSTTILKPRESHSTSTIEVIEIEEDTLLEDNIPRFASSSDTTHLKTRVIFTFLTTSNLDLTITTLPHTKYPIINLTPLLTLHQHTHPHFQHDSNLITTALTFLQFSGDLLSFTTPLPILSSERDGLLDYYEQYKESLEMNYGRAFLRSQIKQNPKIADNFDEEQLNQVVNNILATKLYIPPTPMPRKTLGELMGYNQHRIMTTVAQAYQPKTPAKGAKRTLGNAASRQNTTRPNSISGSTGVTRAKGHLDILSTPLLLETILKLFHSFSSRAILLHFYQYYYIAYYTQCVSHIHGIKPYFDGKDCSLLEVDQKLVNKIVQNKKLSSNLINELSIPTNLPYLFAPTSADDAIVENRGSDQKNKTPLNPASGLDPIKKELSINDILYFGPSIVNTDRQTLKYPFYAPLLSNEPYANLVTYLPTFSSVDDVLYHIEQYGIELVDVNNGSNMSNGMHKIEADSQLQSPGDQLEAHPQNLDSISQDFSTIPPTIPAHISLLLTHDEDEKYPQVPIPTASSLKSKIASQYQKHLISWRNQAKLQSRLHISHLFLPLQTSYIAYLFRALQVNIPRLPPKINIKPYIQKPPTNAVMGNYSGFVMIPWTKSVSSAQVFGTKLTGFYENINLILFTKIITQIQLSSSIIKVQVPKVMRSTGQTDGAGLEIMYTSDYLKLTDDTYVSKHLLPSSHLSLSKNDLANSQDSDMDSSDDDSDNEYGICDDGGGSGPYNENRRLLSSLMGRTLIHNRENPHHGNASRYRDRHGRLTRAPPVTKAQLSYLHKNALNIGKLNDIKSQGVLSNKRNEIEEEGNKFMDNLLTYQPVQDDGEENNDPDDENNSNFDTKDRNKTVSFNQEIVIREHIYPVVQTSNPNRIKDNESELGSSNSKTTSDTKTSHALVYIMPNSPSFLHEPLIIPDTAPAITTPHILQRVAWSVYPKYIKTLQEHLANKTLGSQTQPPPKAHNISILTEVTDTINQNHNQSFTTAYIPTQPLHHRDSFGENLSGLAILLHQPEMFRLLIQQASRQDIVMGGNLSSIENADEVDGLGLTKHRSPGKSSGQKSNNLLQTLFTRDRFGMTILHHLVSNEQFFDANYIESEYDDSTNYAPPDDGDSVNSESANRDGYYDGADNGQMKPKLESTITQIGRKIFRSIYVPYTIDAQIDEYNNLERNQKDSLVIDKVYNRKNAITTTTKASPKIDSTSQQYLINTVSTTSTSQRSLLESPHMLPVGMKTGFPTTSGSPRTATSQSAPKGMISPVAPITPFLTFQRQLFLRTTFYAHLPSPLSFLPPRPLPPLQAKPPVLPMLWLQTSMSFKIEANDKPTLLLTNHHSTIYQFLLYVALIFKNRLVPGWYSASFDQTNVINPYRPYVNSEFGSGAITARSSNLTSSLPYVAISYYPKVDPDEWLYEYMPPLVDLDE